MPQSILDRLSEEREWTVDYDRPQSATEAYKGLRDSQTAGN